MHRPDVILGQSDLVVAQVYKKVVDRDLIEALVLMFVRVHGSAAYELIAIRRSALSRAKRRSDRGASHPLGVASLYTKNGVPLRVTGSSVFNPSGQNFGYISGDRVYGLEGHY